MLGFDRELRLPSIGSGRYDDLVMALPLFFRKEGDEGGVEIGGPGAGQQFGRRSGCKHAAGVHSDEPVEARGFFHIGSRDDHAHSRTLAPDVVDQFPELPTRQRIDTGGRFVENEEIRIVDQRAAEADLLFHAAGKFSGRAVRERSKSRSLQQVGDTTLPFFPVLAEQAPEEIDVFEYRKRGVKVLAKALRHVGDPRAGAVAVPRVGNVAAKHFDPAALNRTGAGDEAKQARLADTVRADEANHDARRDIKAHVVERPDFTIGQADFRQLRDRRSLRLVLRLSRRFLGHCTSAFVSCSGHFALGSIRT